MVYLDHAATTPVKFFAKDYYAFGNPNTLYKLGADEHKRLERAKEIVRKYLGVDSGAVIFGGTASMLIDKLMQKVYNHPCMVYCSDYEHDAVWKYSAASVEFEDFEYTSDWLDEDDVVCWMLTNNVTGEIFPVEEIGKSVKDNGGYFVMDCTAAIGHNAIPSHLEDYCDCVVISAHKFGGPTGNGFMWLSDRFAEHLGLESLPGTPDVSGAMATAVAFVNAKIGETEYYNDIWLGFIERLTLSLANHGIEAVVLENFHKTLAINAIRLYGIKSAPLIQYLSSHEIYVGAGRSACDSDDDDYRVLEVGYNMTEDEAEEVIRVSFSYDTAYQDIDTLIDAIVMYKEEYL